MRWSIAATRGQPNRAMGISTAQRVYRNLTPSQLYEHALRRREGIVTSGGRGPFCAVTSPHTGRSPNDKFLVQEPDSTTQIWWGKVNQPIAPDKFERLKADVEAHLATQELFVRDVYAGADPSFRLPIRFITPNAWRSEEHTSELQSRTLISYA